MGKLFDEIDASLQAWVREQQMFFVATAPLAATGHVNCSPKGLDCLRIVDGNTVAYMDLTGSGAETIAHVRENKRIVLMFCSFSDKPKIVRFHGEGEVVLEGDTDFQALCSLFPPKAGIRSIIRVHVTRISDSCGFAVPIYEFQRERDVLDKWTQHQDEKKLHEYRSLKNAVSIDGLPALDV